MAEKCGHFIGQQGNIAIYCSKPKHAGYDKCFAHDEKLIAEREQARADLNRKAALCDQLVNIARGCHDYGGGYREPSESEIYHHGIQTVVNALEAALKDPNAFQVRMLESIGSRVHSEKA
jgi:hypothetical protein